MTALFMLLLALFTGSEVPSWAGSFLKTQTEVSVTTTSALALAANPYRIYLLLINRGAGTVYIKYNSAHVGTEGIPIPASGNYEPVNPPAEALYAVGSAGVQTLEVIEGTTR